MMGFVSRMWEVAPFAAMVAVECTDVGVSTINKEALAQGMSECVSVVYYNSLATFLLLPYFILHRKKRAPLTLSLICRFFLLGLIGSTGQILFLAGIKLSSPTLSATMSNLTPIYTFLLAVIFGMESLDLRRSTSQAKSLGAIVSVSGALTVTLYEGPAILKTLTNANLHRLQISKQSNWVIGGLMFTISSLLSAAWKVFQGATVKEYPEEMTIVFFFTLFTAIQSLVFAVILERNPDAWKLKPGIELSAILFTAVFRSLFRIGVHTWCLRMKGPLYVAMFNPLGIVIAIVITNIFLGDTLHLGSVIGSIVIAIGFYSVMWGQIKEKKKMTGENEASSARRTPLLEDNASASEVV